jgi:hypothetical protein
MGLGFDLFFFKGSVPVVIFLVGMMIPGLVIFGMGIPGMVTHQGYLF